MNPEDRNVCIDTLKGIGCIFVIFIHIRFPEDTTIGKFIFMFTWFAVPMFFMVSGFYSYNNTVNVLIKKSFKILHILILSTGLYSVYSLFTTFAFTNTTRQLVKTFILSDFHFCNGGHLWFLSALFYSYLIFAMATKYKLNKKIYYLIIPLFILRFIVKYFYIDIAYLHDNVFLTGLPYFLIGNLIAENKKIIKTKINVILPIIISLSGIGIIGMRRFMPIDMSYIGVIIYTIGLFLFAIVRPTFKIKCLSILGEKYSLYIYVFHMLIIYWIGNRVSYYWLAPIIVCIISIIFSIIFSKFATLIKGIRI